MPRYVILEHDHPYLHWDFMLETGAVLRTWRLASTPSFGASVQATAIGDHRLVYLDYQGLVAGNRGSVSQWDSGDYEEMENVDKRLVLRLRGRRLWGTANLQLHGSGWSLCLTPIS